MCKVTRYLLVILCLLPFCNAFAADVKTDTIETTYGDKVIVSYEVGYVNKEFHVRFNDIKKILGARHRKKYDDMENVTVLVFDRTGKHKDYDFTGAQQEAFQVQPGLKYDKDNAFQDGFVGADDLRGHTLVFDNKDGENHQLEIPFFFAHYTEKNLLKLIKKSKYELFAKCSTLTIDLKVPVTKQTKTIKGEMISAGGVVEQTQEVNPIDWGTPDYGSIGAGLSPDEEAEMRIGNIERLLTSQNDAFDNQLKGEIEGLTALQYKVTSEAVRKKIENTLDKCTAKQKDIEKATAAAAAAAAEKQAAEQKAMQDSVNAVAQQKADKAEKRTLWMIICGFVLAVLGFFGNQLGQHFRTRNNLRNMDQMQQGIMKRVEHETRLRSQSMMRQKIHQAEGTVKRKVRETTKSTARRVIGQEPPKGQTVAKPKPKPKPMPDESSNERTPRPIRTAVNGRKAQPKRTPISRKPGSSNTSKLSDNVSI